MPVTVTRDTEDSDVAAWLRSVPESELAKLRQASDRAARERLIQSMERLGTEFRTSGGTEEDLKDILDMNDEEFQNIFRG